MGKPLAIETRYNAFCPGCETLVSLADEGRCLGCGAVCSAYPEFLRVVRLFGDECGRIAERYPVAFVCHDYRGALESGVLAEYLIEDVQRLARENDPERFPPLGFPKLDIVAVTLKHVWTLEKVTIHEDRFPSRFYPHGSQECVPLGMATGALLDREVFSREILEEVLPDHPESALPGLRFFDLQLALALLLARNRLWYAALAERYYLFPVECVCSSS